MNMERLSTNPLVELAAERPAWMLRARGQGIIAAGLCWALLGLYALGICGCTVFALVSLSMVLATCFGVGNTAFGALTIEREKKTLDSLRLTQLSAHEVLLGKLLPELWTLGVLVAFTAPTVIVASWLAGDGLLTGLEVVGIGTLGGLFAAVSAIFMSSLFATTSQAVVAGWIVKLLWLVATPLLDMVAGAVLVQPVSPPVFSAFNPLAAAGVLLIPEGASGARTVLPLLFPLASLLAIVAMWLVAAHRFATGMASGAGLRDRHVHPVYRKGWGPRWLTDAIPMLRHNPAFLRELAAQVRSGAGRWPGYMVFVVLFLAPTFYARSWSMTEMGRAQLERPQRHVEVVQEPAHDVKTALGPLAQHSVYLRTYTGTEVVLEGHTSNACLRMFLFDVASIPLPKDSLRFYETRYANSGYGNPTPTATRVDHPDAQTARVLGLEPARSDSEITEESRATINQSSVSVGLAGAIALFLLYLAIRYSAFMATAVTGERARRTWEDLALSGISARDFMRGKTAAAVLLPWVQMTLAFPALLVFVWWGNISVFEVGELYVYAVALTIAASMLGLWTSAASETSHDAHLRALAIVLFAFMVLPVAGSLLGPVLVAGATVACLANAAQGRAAAVNWLCVALALGIAPHAVSPLTAAVAFMPSLTTTQSFLTVLGVAPSDVAMALVNLACAVLLLGSLSNLMWRSALGRLEQGSDALKADRQVPAESLCFSNCQV